MGARVFLVDNYDSFTYNLFQYLAELGAEVEVRRNDRFHLEEVAEGKPDLIVISPGPSRPEKAGLTIPLIRRFGAEIPIFGVCLGHQAIGVAYGGRVVRAARVMHGKTSLIHHDGRGLFGGLPNPFEATRYHSLLVEREGLPERLEVCAETEEGEIMGLRVQGLPVAGVQFHPESILTAEGKRLLKNVLEGGLRDVDPQRAFIEE